MRAACLAIALLCLLASKSLACADGEVSLFSCQTLDKTGEPSEGGFAFCAGNQDADGVFQSIHYEYGAAEAVDFSYPRNPAEGRQALLFHHYFKDQLYHARIRFETGGDTYVGYYDDNPPSTDPDEVTGPDAGVRVLRNGKVIADIVCGERPSSYFDDIRKATSCDITNPYGERACGYDAPEVK
jgi:hypothetical protein